MRKLLVIGIGAGDPDFITIQAVNALNEVDVFFIIDKGEEKDELVALRKELCRRYIEDQSFRIVEAPDPERDRKAEAYASAVENWYQKRAEIFEQMMLDELAEDGCGGFLVWGDPTLYDSTIRIIELIKARNRVAFTYKVIPGISAVQALVARHRLPINRIGEAIHITTGRKLAEGLPQGVHNAVIMLDSQNAFLTADPEAEIYWGAYLGTKSEILIAGKLRDVAPRIVEARAEARAAKGWIMDTYLLRFPRK
ncbi:precorrin-6A synthase (deacetylating) [Taklimakanibacter lacteus]|uniref:precorrin-6A synthase (deacetylating) n=1 Tax=Taklimakanibacter lacteus TaxID=2268456 RepID=UPI000E67027D